MEGGTKDYEFQLKAVLSSSQNSSDLGNLGTSNLEMGMTLSIKATRKYQATRS